MGMDENYHRLLDENMALIESPLIAPSNSHFRQHYKTALYPYNVSVHTNGGHYDSNNNNNGGYFAVTDQDPDGNGDGLLEHQNSVEKQSRYCHSLNVRWIKIAVRDLHTHTQFGRVGPNARGLCVRRRSSI